MGPALPKKSRFFCPMKIKSTNCIYLFIYLFVLVGLKLIVVGKFLQMLMPAAGCKVIEMLEKWKGMLSKCGEVEIEVSEWFKMLTQDIVAQTAFGSSYQQGKAIFRLQAQQMQLTSEALQKVFIPGYR